jgi:glutamyl/glutaminyl-tRNA synthetase
MYSKLISVGSALLLGSALTFTAAAQDNAVEKAREQSIDTASQQNAQHEPHMAAALQHLRQAEEELEKASPNKGGHLVRAMELTKQAEAQVNEGMQYYNQNVSPLNSAAAQESTAENAREQQVDTAATGNMSKQPSMAAALSHLRQAEEELEKANNEHGGFRAQALQQVQQAEATVVKGLQWYNTNVLNKDKKK